jgi:hypothetical protein
MAVVLVVYLGGRQRSTPGCALGMTIDHSIIFRCYDGHRLECIRAAYLFSRSLSGYLLSALINNFDTMYGNVSDCPTSK